jgi:hypothetical protein
MNELVALAWFGSGILLGLVIHFAVIRRTEKEIDRLQADNAHMKMLHVKLVERWGEVVFDDDELNDERLVLNDSHRKSVLEKRRREKQRAQSAGYADIVANSEGGYK